MKAKSITFHRKKNLAYFDLSARSNFNIDKPFVRILRDLTGYASLSPSLSFFFFGIFLLVTPFFPPLLSSFSFLRFYSDHALELTEEPAHAPEEIVMDPAQIAELDRATNEVFYLLPTPPYHSLLSFHLPLLIVKQAANVPFIDDDEEL